MCVCTIVYEVRVCTIVCVVRVYSSVCVCGVCAQECACVCGKEILGVKQGTGVELLLCGWFSLLLLLCCFVVVLLASRKGLLGQVVVEQSRYRHDIQNDVVQNSAEQVQTA